MIRAACILALLTAVASLKIQKTDGPAVQVVTFATPYRLTTGFARVQPDALMSSVKSDFEEKGFEPIVNLGAGKVWTGNYQEKITFLKAFLNKPENKEKIVVFADGEDVIMGGCDKSEMLEKYNGIVKKSGAPIIFAAELWCFEPPTQKEKPLPGWGQCPEPGRAAWAQEAYGNDKELDEKIRAFQDERSIADKTTSLINLNSGFFMGPAIELLKMMEYASDAKMWFKLHNGTDYYGDQRMYSQYWFENPDKVTLDYGAELTLTAHGFKNEALKMDASGDVHNLIFNRKQFLVHGSGFAKAMVGDLQMQRAIAKGDKTAELMLKARCVTMPESCSQGQETVNKLKDIKNAFFQKK